MNKTFRYVELPPDSRTPTSSTDLADIDGDVRSALYHLHAIGERDGPALTGISLTHAFDWMLNLANRLHTVRLTDEAKTTFEQRIHVADRWICEIFQGDDQRIYRAGLAAALGLVTNAHRGRHAADLLEACRTLVRQARGWADLRYSSAALRIPRLHIVVTALDGMMAEMPRV